MFGRGDGADGERLRLRGPDSHGLSVWKDSRDGSFTALERAYSRGASETVDTDVADA